jgi:hypothetical protein
MSAEPRDRDTAMDFHGYEVIVETDRHADRSLAKEVRKASD